nr:hypothetical protein [Tanacetum cinerariifolium]
MSDASSAVTYTSVYTNSEPWRYYREDSAETGPLRVIVYRYDGLFIQPVASPSPDYVPRPEHPPSPDYAPLEDQPLPTDASPIATSPDYMVDSDPEEDSKEDPEDDQADYPADGGDGDDEPSDDDDDGDTDDEDPEEEPFDEDDEEYPAPANSSAVPIGDLVLLAGEKEALEADEPTHAPGSPISIPFSQTHLRRARKTVRPEPPMSASMKACIARHAALPSPPLFVPSLQLPLPSPLTTSPTDTGAPLGYRAAEIRMRALLSSTSRRTDIPEADMPPRKRACLITSTPGFEIGESSATGYVITSTWDEIVDKMKEIAPTTLEGVNERVTELDTTVRQMTDKDRPDHRRIAMLMDREAMYSCEAWEFSMDRSSAIAAHIRTLETHVAALITQTTSLQTQLTMALGRIEVLEVRDPEPRRDQLRPAAADQSLPTDASPIAASPDYVADSDPEEDPEDDQADYPADGGDGDNEPFDGDDDGDTGDEDLEEEPFNEDDEEHPAPADSSAVPIRDLVLSAGETEALEADEPTHAPGSPIRAPLGYRAAEIRMRALLSSTYRKTDIPEADMPPRKRACLTTSTPGFEIRESSAAGAARQPGPTESDLRRCRVEQAGYVITDTWDKIVDKMMKIAPTTLEEVNERVTELDTTVRQRTDEFEVASDDLRDTLSVLYLTSTRLRSLLIQGLSNDIYSLIDINKTTKDLWDALARHMLGSEYDEQDKKAAVLYEYETLEATEGELLLDTYIRYLQVINDLNKCGYSKDNCELNFKFLNNLQPEWKQYATNMRHNKSLMDINIDALYNILKQNQGDVNDAMGLTKKIVVVTSDPLALITEKTELRKRK